MSAIAPNSPRLPSPPPSAEIPAGIPMDHGAHNEQLAEAALYRINSKRRVHPGTRSKDMASGPPLVNLSELDSPFQLQEHLAALHYYHTESSINPVTRSVAAILAQPPPSVDRIVWLYELCRFLISQCNTLIVGFLFDTPPCSAATCPEMRASEWQFLCAVHETPKSCCAIDYCCHTLDWAANVITDPKLFPSRFIKMSESHMTTPGMKTLINVFRRLHRIFAHAWFLHRNVFWAVEDPSGLYILFKTVCNIYNLLPGDAYELPPEAEGLVSQQAPTVEHTSDRKVSGPITIIKQFSMSKNTSAPTPTEESERPNSRAGNHDNNTAHSGTSSVGSVVGTVHEDEEDNTSSRHSEDIDDNVYVAQDAETVSSPEDSSKLPSPTGGNGAKDKDFARRKSPSRAKPSQVPVPVESSKPFSDDITITSNDYIPGRAKTASPRPGSGSGSINLPPSKLPKKASPRPPKAILRTASPAGTTLPSAIPPPMHTASGGTVIAPALTKTSTPEPPVNPSTTMATDESDGSIDENTSKAIELPESQQAKPENGLTEESEESEESDVDAVSKEEAMHKDEEEEGKQEHADEIPEVKAESEGEDKADEKADEGEKSEEKEDTVGLKAEDKPDEKTKKKKRRKSKAKGKGDNKATTSEA
ncbi:hypothetical protein Cpir12675_001732 [Ceratocystis pirilliformis]|uniref:MOB kinase activator-like 4 n=1 Tax=Ceratocystis pirilliformis TaxID=259994 RepID=A0ABR3ZGQ9_9PEZI